MTGNLCAGIFVNTAGYGSYTAMLGASTALTASVAYVIMSFLIFPGLPFGVVMALVHYFGHKSWEGRQAKKASML